MLPSAHTCTATIAALLILTAAVARADFLTETAYDYGIHTTGYNLLPPFPPPFVSYTAGALGGPDIDAAQTASYTSTGFKFALGSALPSGASITSATLSLAVVKTDPIGGRRDGPLILDVAGFGSSPGALKLADFAQGFPSPNVGRDPNLPVFIGSTYPGGLVVETFNVTSLLGSTLAAGSSSVLFQLDLEFASYAIFFGGPNDANPANRPTLVISYASAVPEPASALLCLVGLGGALIAVRAARSPR